MYLRLEMTCLKPLLSFLFIWHLNPLSLPLFFAPCHHFVLYYHSTHSLLNTSLKKVIKQVKEALPILKTCLMHLEFLLMSLGALVVELVVIVVLKTLRMKSCRANRRVTITTCVNIHKCLGLGVGCLRCWR